MRCTIMKWWTPIAVLAIGTLFLTGVTKAATVDFEDLTLDPESYWNGSDESGGFTSKGFYFNNNYDTTYDSWDGWSYSNKTDIDSTGTDGQYTAYANAPDGGGAGDSSNYGVAYVGWAGPPTVTLPWTEGSVGSAYFTNNAYAHDSMLNGDAFAKKFGGASGDDEDWFLLTITGKDSIGGSTGTVDFYLADYRFDDNDDDYIIDDWTSVDLSSLGNEVSSLEFGLTSSDNGGYGMNTPAYFAMDSMSVVPEPSTVALALSGALALLLWWRRRRNA